MKIPLSLAIWISAICLLSACGGGSSNSGGGGGTGGATHFAVTAPGAATAGTPFTIAVVALNSSNKTATGYSGTVHFRAATPKPYFLQIRIWPMAWKTFR